ncbi:hypothetical protein [Streptomyces sp. NPDC026673]|uniref:hypothetical protein n=1 Tax=Streptomyces sp. NPDC026673 TaxID=3155724 RepID=UPI0033EB44F6
MNDLIDHVLRAHGGRGRWSEIDSLNAEVSFGGPFWSLRGFAERPFGSRLTVDTRRERIRFAPWPNPEGGLTFDADEDAVELRSPDGEILERRTGVRSGYTGYDLSSPWDSAQVGYFIGYAMWNYLTTPFLFTRPGVESREVASWSEGGEVWRRLQVTFPRDVATHCAEQTFYFAEDGMLCRLDYHVDVNMGVSVAHYVGDYRDFDGIVFPTRRRVHRRNPDNTASENCSIEIDVREVRVG